MVVGLSVFGSKHRENHLEPRERLERVRLTDEHEIHLSAMQAMRVAGDADFYLAFEHLHQCIVRGCVLAQALTFVEGEERHAAGGPFNDFAADDRAVLVVDVVKDFGDLSAGESFGIGWGFWFQMKSGNHSFTFRQHKALPIDSSLLASGKYRV